MQDKDKLKRLRKERKKLKEENAGMRDQINSGNPLYEDMCKMVEQETFELSYAKLNYTEEGFIELAGIICDFANSVDTSSENKEIVNQFFDDAVHLRRIVSLIKTR